MEQKLHDAAQKLPVTTMDFDAITPEKRSNGKFWRVIASVAACLVLIIAVGLISVEAKEYSDAVEFFEQHGLSTQGLSRDEIKAVYRDIITKSFSYAKTSEVIAASMSSDQIRGYEILQPKPDDAENLWNYRNFSAGFSIENRSGSRYEYRSEYREDPELGFSVHDKSFVEKYDGDVLLWSVPISEFWVRGYCAVSDGVIAYGDTPTWSSEQITNAWMTKINSDGELLWTRKLDNGFEYEYIAQIFEHKDGYYDIISRGDFEYFCFSRYSADGSEILFQKTLVGNYGFENAASFKDGYIVQLCSYMANEHAKILKVDYEGNITESFSYDSEDAYYYITDMIEYNDQIFLSAYAVPKTEDGPHVREIDAVLKKVYEVYTAESFEEKLTRMVRENYTAMLLLCDSNSGVPQEFYSVEGSLGGELSLDDSGKLLWDVESIADTFFSPATSSFTIGGSAYVFRYMFDSDGALVNREETKQVVPFRR